MNTDKTQEFIGNPENFLRLNPVIVAVSPDHRSRIGYFKICTSLFCKNPISSQNPPCELEIDREQKSQLKAYWCPYEPDLAMSLSLENDANFMFTANMDGCSFAVNSAQRPIYIVSHSNAATIGAKINEFVDNPVSSSLMQKAIQKHMALKAVGTENTTVKHSLSGNCTTIVGIRAASTNTWHFFKQVNKVEGSYGDQVSVISMTTY